jgi:predicted transcriptional regulator
MDLREYCERESMTILEFAKKHKINSTTAFKVAKRSNGLYASTIVKIMEATDGDVSIYDMLPVSTKNDVARREKKNKKDDKKKRSKD